MLICLFVLSKTWIPFSLDTTDNIINSKDIEDYFQWTLQ